VFYLELFVIYELGLAEQLLIPAQVPQSGVRFELPMFRLFSLLEEASGALLFVRLRGTVFKERPMFL
jgi:hypothetical protein